MLKLKDLPNSKAIRFKGGKHSFKSPRISAEFNLNSMNIPRTATLKGSSDSGLLNLKADLGVREATHRFESWLLWPLIGWMARFCNFPEWILQTLESSPNALTIFSVAVDFQWTFNGFEVPKRFSLKLIAAQKLEISNLKALGSKVLISEPLIHRVSGKENSLPFAFSVICSPQTHSRLACRTKFSPKLWERVLSRVWLCSIRR